MRRLQPLAVSSAAVVLFFVFFLPLHLHFFNSTARVGNECSCYHGARIQTGLTPALARAHSRASDLLCYDSRSSSFWLAFNKVSSGSRASIFYLPLSLSFQSNFFFPSWSDGRGISLSLGGGFMDFFKKSTRAVSACLLVWCLIIFPRIGLAQESVTDTLRKQIGDMQEQLKKALDRIDQLEKEKSASSD